MEYENIKSSIQLWKGDQKRSPELKNYVNFLDFFFRRKETSSFNTHDTLKATFYPRFFLCKFEIFFDGFMGNFIFP